MKLCPVIKEVRKRIVGAKKEEEKDKDKKNSDSGAEETKTSKLH